MKLLLSLLVLLVIQERFLAPRCLFQVNTAFTDNLLATLPDTRLNDSYFRQLYDLNRNLQQTGRTPLQLTPEEEVLVRQIAATNTLAAMNARIILYTAFGEEIMFALPQIPALVADETGNWNVHFKTNTTDLSGKVLVYPNPAKEEISVQIHLSEATPAHLQIYDAKGTLIQQTAITDTATTLVFDIAQWTSGLYYYRLINDRNVPCIGKFVVTGNR